MKCVIFGAGPISDYEATRALLPEEPYTILAADGGLRHTNALGLTPDAFIGDMDSLREEDIPEGAILYPSRKDDTDMMLAVKKALAIGAKEIWMFGGLGGRLDHSYANIQTLAYLLEYGVSGVLMDENHRVSMIADGQREKMSLAYHYLSVFAYGGACIGVNITGAEYLLEDATLTPFFPLGCSNRHAPGKQMEVSVEHGTLLLIQTKLN